MGSKCLFWMLLEPSISYIGKKQGRYGFGYGLWLWLRIWLQYAVFMEKWLMLVLGKKGNEYVHYYMAHIMSIVATVKTVLLLFCVLTFYTIMPLHLNPYSFIEVLLLYFVEYSPRTYIKVVLHRASWRATQIKKDQHKKYHIFGSRRSYIAPKSLFTSLRYI